MQSRPLRHRVHEYLKLCPSRRSLERHYSSEGTVDERFTFIEPIPRKVTVSSLDVNTRFDKNCSVRFSRSRKVQSFGKNTNSGSCSRGQVSTRKSIFAGGAKYTLHCSPLSTPDLLLSVARAKELPNHFPLDGKPECFLQERATLSFVVKLL